MSFRQLCWCCCLLLGPASGQAASLQPGTLVRAQGKSAIHVVLPSGRLAHIPALQVLRCLALDRRPVVDVPSLALDVLPKSPLLLRGPDGRVFRVDGALKRHIVHPGVMQQLGYAAAAPLAVEESQLRCLADGPPLQ